MTPPLFARALLLAVAGAPESHYVAGDLEEEFAQLCHCRGRSAASRWYLRQVIGSLPPLLALRIRSGQLTGVLLRAVIGIGLPLMALDRLWCFVYSQIPLKDGTGRAPEYLAFNLVCIGLAAALSAPPGAAGAIASGCAAAFALACATGATPLPYTALVILAVVLIPCCKTVRARRRRL